MTNTARTLDRSERHIARNDDYLCAEELAELTPAVLLERLRAIQPMIAAHAAEAEANRRPHDDVWNAIRKTGFFYQFVPKAYGGMETSFDGFIDAGMAIAEACPSTSWCATFCAEHNWIFSHFSKEAHAEIWGGNYPYIVAPMVAMPPAIAVPEDGGYRINGHWRWGTGVMHADWVMGQCLVPQEGGMPKPLMVIMPVDEVDILDTWFSGGMAGTGSNDIVAKDLFIPANRAVFNPDRGGVKAADRKYENPIYGVPMLPFLGMSASIPAVGAVRGMVKRHQERITQFGRPGSDARLSDKVPAQIRLAKADTLARSAEILIRDAGRRLIGLCELEEPDRTRIRLELRAQLAHAVQVCREAAALLVEGAGTSVHLGDDPFARAMRDILVLSTHVVFDPDIAFEQHGRGMVGLKPNTLLS